MKARFTFLSGARAGQVEAFHKAYIGLGRHPLSDLRFDAERDLDVSSRHAAVVRKPEGFILQDLGSRNGTFVNGRRVSGDTPLADGDVIAFGATGPAVAFHVLPAGPGETPSTAGAEKLAARVSQPRDVLRATPRPSTAVRIAAEVAQLRRTTKVLIVLLLVAAGAFAWLQLQGARRARELARLEARADSLMRAAERLSARFRSELQGVQDALAQARAETAKLRRDVAAAAGDPGTVARLRAQLDDAERRQRALIGAVGAVDYRAVARANQDAVAMVLVEFSETERYSATGFAVDSNGTVVTNRHVLVGEDGTRVPRRIGVIFAGSRQMFHGELIGVSGDADLGVLRVTIRGGTPRVAGIATSRDAGRPERGDPVAIIGYPLGLDLPMDDRERGPLPVVEPTLTVATVSKTLPAVVQLDGYGAPGSSGSPVFDRAGKVVAVVYGGREESQGRIVFGVPASVVADYLRTVGLGPP